MKARVKFELWNQKNTLFLGTWKSIMFLCALHERRKRKKRNNRKFSMAKKKIQLSEHEHLFLQDANFNKSHKNFLNRIA